MSSAVLFSTTDLIFRSFITIVGFCLQDLHRQLENSNLDPREIERARKGQVSVKKFLAVTFLHFKETFFLEVNFNGY